MLPDPAREKVLLQVRDVVLPNVRSFLREVQESKQHCIWSTNTALRKKRNGPVVHTHCHNIKWVHLVQVSTLEQPKK